MWNLDDPRQFKRVLRLSVDRAHTWADMRPGHTDRERRERLRADASKHIQDVPGNRNWWALRIAVRKSGQRLFDLENVAKPIIDAFCKRQIEKDNSPFAEAGLYPDDSIDHVRIIQLHGERSESGDSTVIEIFAFIG